MGLRLQRVLSGVASLDAGQWCSQGTEFRVCCPICSAIIRLDARHVVGRDGRVTPAVSCAACPFLDWIELGGFEC